MKTKIKISQGRSGYTATYELPWGERIRHIGYATKDSAQQAAEREIARRMATRK